MSSRIDISNVGGKADWVFHVLGVKQVRYLKYLTSSSLGASCTGGKADWVLQISKN